MADPEPQKHHRRSIRLSGWDYRDAAVYFVTICTHNRENIFDEPTWADVAKATWQAIPSHSVRVVLDEWVLMSNHLHGLLALTDSPNDAVFTGRFDMRWATPANESGGRTFANAPSGSLGAIIRSYKAVVTRHVNRMRNTPSAKVWQRGYYERIVRDERELERIRAYIQDNPARWAADQDELNVLLTRMRLR